MAHNQKPRLQIFYEKEIVKTLYKQLSLKNYMQTIKLTKIVVNMGIGDAAHNPKIINSNRETLELICGQKAIITKAKKSIAAFKLRKHMNIGIKITLRRNKMWEFLDRLINIALPRVRDFRGISSKLDGHGNISLGIEEQIIFPEVNYDKIEKIRGFNISLITSTTNNKAGYLLFKHLGIPFK